jgi:hypothetical protein
MFDPDVEECLLRVYGVDPQQATPRRVWVLLQRLPLGAWHKDQGPASWTNEAYLMAQVVDAVNQVAWVQVAVNSKKKPKPPKPVWRPGAKDQKQKTSWADLEAALSGVEGVIR